MFPIYNPQTAINTYIKNYCNYRSEKDSINTNMTQLQQLPFNKWYLMPLFRMDIVIIIFSAMSKDFMSILIPLGYY